MKKCSTLELPWYIWTADFKKRGYITMTKSKLAGLWHHYDDTNCKNRRLIKSMTKAADRRIIKLIIVRITDLAIDKPKHIELCTIINTSELNTYKIAKIKMTFCTKSHFSLFKFLLLKRQKYVHYIFHSSVNKTMYIIVDH